MGFIEAILNPIFLPKMLPKPKKSPKTKERKHINSQTSQNRAGQGAATAVPRCTTTRATMYGRASRHGVLLGLLAVRSFCLECMAVRPCCTAVSFAIFPLLCFS